MKIILNSIILIFSISVNVFANITWEKDYSSAIAKAKSQDIPIVISVYIDLCDACDNLEEVIFNDKDVSKAIREGFVALKVNPDTMEDGNVIARRYGVEGYPTILFINSDDILLTLHNGYVESSDFIKYLDEASLRHKEVKDIFAKSEATLEKLEIYFSSGKEKEAKDVYNELVENNKIDESEIVSYIFGFALLKSQNGKYEEATSEFNIIIKKYSGSDEAYMSHYYIAVIMLLTGDIENATKYLEDILARDNSVPEDFSIEYQNLLEYIKTIPN